MFLNTNSSTGAVVFVELKSADCLLWANLDVLWDQYTEEFRRYCKQYHACYLVASSWWYRDTFILMVHHRRKSIQNDLL